VELQSPRYRGEQKMTARSMWQGTLTFQKHEIAVKLYSA
jgi:hypothetical protein